MLHQPHQFNVFADYYCCMKALICMLPHLTSSSNTFFFILRAKMAFNALSLLNSAKLQLELNWPEVVIAFSFLPAFTLDNLHV